MVSRYPVVYERPFDDSRRASMTRWPSRTDTLRAWIRAWSKDSVVWSRIVQRLWFTALPLNSSLHVGFSLPSRV
jgi:hypothetical protein